MPGIREAAEKLEQSSDRVEKLGEKFSKVDSIETDATIKEGFLSKSIPDFEPSSVAGIDGGIVKKRYSAGDVVAVRAVAAVFRYGEKLDVAYLPEKSPEPDFQVFGSQEADSLEKNAERSRLEEETKIAKEALGEANTVLMDGSIVPSYLDSQAEIDSYSDLFETAEEGQLAGVVEDSYGLKLSRLLDQKLGFKVGKIRDTRLMDAILEPGERSFVRRYSSSPVEHPVLKKMEDRHVNRLNTFYVRLSSKDLPLRVDFYGSAESADRIAGILKRIRASESYTVPAPIVEADKRAKIPGKHVKRLEKRFSPEFKRRDRRSF